MVPLVLVGSPLLSMRSYSPESVIVARLRHHHLPSRSSFPLCLLIVVSSGGKTVATDDGVVVVVTAALSCPLLSLCASRAQIKS